jgi:hypothetical protein
MSYNVKDNTNDFKEIENKILQRTQTKKLEQARKSFSKLILIELGVIRRFFERIVYQNECIVKLRPIQCIDARINFFCILFFYQKINKQTNRP